MTHFPWRRYLSENNTGNADSPMDQVAEPSLTLSPLRPQSPLIILINLCEAYPYLRPVIARKFATLPWGRGKGKEKGQGTSIKSTSILHRNSLQQNIPTLLITYVYT